MNTILCPHCKKPVEITEALSSQLEKEIQEKMEARHRQEIEKIKQEAKAESAKRMKEQFELEMKRLQEETAEYDARNKKLVEQIASLMKDLRQMRTEKDEAKLEMEKKLVEEEEKIRRDAQKKAEEEQRLKIVEKDKQLASAMQEVEEMRRKLQQGSQQLQGEAFEVEFEELLTTQYPNDKITPVGKGIKGGDIIQEVWDRNGNFVGKIMWELKNTKTWSEQWIDKLKIDKRACNADEAVIISEAMPSSIKVAGYHNGVWVSKQEFVFPLTDSLRAKLIQLFILKNSLKGKDMKMEALYTYLTGTEFKNRIEAIVEAFSNMQQEIEKEKRYFANKWARDEKNIRQVIDSTYGMHGDLKGILAGVVPQIKGIDVRELTDGVKQ